jgi:hypothetical protein
MKGRLSLRVSLPRMPMQSQRLGIPQRGVNIVGGKKIMVK